MTKKSNAKKLKFVKSVLRSKFEADLVLIIEEKSFFSGKIIWISRVVKSVAFSDAQKSVNTLEHVNTRGVNTRGGGL